MKFRALMVALVAVMTLAVVSPRVQAQALNIPNNILGSESFTPEIRTELDRIVTVYIDRLKNAKSPNEIRDIVNELMKPLTIGNNGIGTSTFKVEYSSLLSGKMTRIMSGNYSPTKKAAVLKIASTLSLGTGHRLALSGLTNEDPAVRFWATKAVTDIIKRSIRERYFRNTTGQQVRTMIMQALVNAMEKETEPIVMEQYYLAMGLLRTLESVEKTLTILDQRLSLYEGGINDNIRADHEGIFRSWRTLFLTRATVNPKITRKLVITAVLYAQIARVSLVQNEVSLENYAATMNMLTTAESIILMVINNKDRENEATWGPLMKPYLENDATGKLGVKPELSVKDAVETNDLLGAVQRLGAWIAILTDPKMKLGYKQADFTPKGG